MSRIVDGGAFVLDAPEHIPAIWGAGTDVLWAQGESLLVCGPQGVGKSTVVQQLALARCGVGPLTVAGQLVTPDSDRRVLYLAMDRPAQIARSMRRMVREASRADLVDRFRVWAGPLPFSVLDEPAALLALARENDAGTVVIDSLKDLAAPLSEEKVGAGVNQTLQYLVAAGIEVVGAHHQRKATSDNKKPTSLSDVYGSTWITSGAGSVVLLWGQAGDPVVELTHIKQPADEVGPLQLVHDHDAGTTTVLERVTAYELLRQATDGGLTAKAAAMRLYDSTGRNSVERARRKLEQLVRQGHAVPIQGNRTDPTIYRPVDHRHANKAVNLKNPMGTANPAKAVNLREPPVNPSRNGSRGSRFGSTTDHGGFTDVHAPAVSAADPPFRGSVHTAVNLGEHWSDEDLEALIDAEAGDPR